jgi:O-antigen ligase
MKLPRTLGVTETRQVQNLILFGGVLTTLAIWTNLEDPINLPKMIVLVISAAAVLGFVLPTVPSAYRTAGQSQRIGLLLIALLAFGLLISTLATDVKYTAIFGEYHRNNGALTFAASLILALAAGLVFTKQTFIRPLRTLSLLGVFLSTYGLAQFVGIDPVGWKNQYNPIITTLGNPNFTSGIIGISGIASLYFLIESKNYLEKAVAALSLVFGLFIVLKSDSIQGVFAFAVGAATLLIVKAWSVSNRVGYTASSVIFVVGSSILLAIFNIGPLASRLYQGTLNNRIDYWHAAVNMFKVHPMLGVGIDRYGENYREFAVQNQVSQGTFSNNAHNVYLQLLATGGLVLFIPYIALLLFISWLAFRGVFQARHESRILAASYLAIWLSFLILNIVTIDNIGVGTWMWIFGGLVIARSAIAPNEDLNIKNLRSAKNKKIPTALSLSPKLMSFALVAAALVVCLPLSSASQHIQELKFNKKSLDDGAFITSITNEATANLDNPQVLTLLADLALQKNNSTLALDISHKIINADSRSFYGTFFLAGIYDAIKQRNLGIPYREQLLMIDKWNTDNMYELVKSYVEIKDFAKARALALHIETLYPDSENSKKSSLLISGLGK